jgi:hypothetical protein
MMLKRRALATGEMAKGAQSAPFATFLTSTARRRKCVQQRDCRGDGASLVSLRPRTLTVELGMILIVA